MYAAMWARGSTTRIGGSHKVPDLIGLFRRWSACLLARSEGAKLYRTPSRNAHFTGISDNADSYL